MTEVDPNVERMAAFPPVFEFASSRLLVRADQTFLLRDR